MRITRNARVAAALWIAVLARSAGADEIADKGRDILVKYQHSVVTVEIVIKLKYSFPGLGGQANEYKQDLTGTVVDPSGLTVLSLSTCEPGDLMQSYIAGLSDEEGNSKVKMSSELSDLNLLLEDGTELAADIVLRDRDLDLAFIRPRTRPAAPMAALDLGKSGKAGVLDQVITLNRLGASAGRAYAASVERITAVVQKPRLFYIPGSDPTSTMPGCPAFTLDGNVLGVCVTRSVKQKGETSPMPGLGDEPGLTSIILPAEQILKVARQAPEAKADSGKSPEPKEPKAGGEKP